jgi:hypothetical protein
MEKDTKLTPPSGYGTRQTHLHSSLKIDLRVIVTSFSYANDSSLTLYFCGAEQDF